ncbi:MAG: hypothetical protein AB7I18_05215 [Candidatus Berkiella sp.]
MSANGATNSTTQPQTGLGLDMIELDFNKLCKVSGWHNNCGLNCLSHFLFDKLSSLPQGEFDLFIAANEEYVEILKTFKEYYGLNNNVGWQDILGLLRAHPAATDREALLAPVLRKHLGKILLGHSNELWDTKASAAFGDCIDLESQVYQDISVPIYHSNKAFYDKLRNEFEVAFMQALEAEVTPAERLIAEAQLRDNSNNKKIPNYQPTNDDILRHVIFQRKSRLQDQFNDKAQINWMTEGCQRYADHIGDMKNMVMISADQLQLLCESLNIGLDVFTFASMQQAITNRATGEHTRGAQWVAEREFHWKMKVFNMGGVHWIFQEPNRDEQKVKQHNQYYTAPLSPELAGKYRIACGPVSKELIIAEVKHMMGEMSIEELTQIKQIAELAAALAAAQRQEMAKQAQQQSASLLVFSVFDSSKEGKALYELITSHPGALALVNQHFDVTLARAFVQKFGFNIEALKAVSGPTLVVFLDKFAKQHKPVQVVGHALTNAFNASLPAPILVARDSKPSIKLTHLAIMQKNDTAKRMTVLIGANPLAVAAFNQFSDECVHRFADSLKNPQLLEAYAKLAPKDQVVFIQRFAEKQLTQKAAVKNAL